MSSPSLYNGKKPVAIEDNLPEDMPDVHRKEYMKNVHNVIDFQKAGISQPLIENIKNFNNQLIKLYL